MAKSTAQRATARRAQPRITTVKATGLAAMKNLGAESIEMLAAAGIRTRNALTELGSVGAYVAVKRAGQKPTLNLLYALEGAIRDIAWTDLPYQVRASLTLEADAYLDAEGIR